MRDGSPAVIAIVQLAFEEAKLAHICIPLSVLFAVLVGVDVVLARYRSGMSSAVQTVIFEVATNKPTVCKDGTGRLQPTVDGYTGVDISLLHLIGEA